MGVPLGNSEIDTVVLRPVRLAAETGNKWVANRPAERRHSPTRLRSFDDGFGRPWLFLSDERATLRRWKARNLFLFDRLRLRGL